MTAEEILGGHDTNKVLVNQTNEVLSLKLSSKFYNCLRNFFRLWIYAAEKQAKNCLFFSSAHARKYHSVIQYVR